MARYGPLPEPRRLQVVKGDRKRKGKPLSNPPVVVPAAPPKPDDLGDDGSRLWDLVTPELVRMTILSQIDLVVLEMYCRVYDEWRREDPESRRWLWCIDRLTTLAIQLGLTPAARLRLNLPEPRARYERAIYGIPQR
jgi:phage terminase small subunit